MKEKIRYQTIFNVTITFAFCLLFWSILHLKIKQKYLENQLQKQQELLIKYKE